MSYEPIINVYQTLVAYDGSSTTNFVPQLATCVPGTAACTALYGSTLVTNNASTGLPQYFTFVLDSAAHFYDPSTGNSWGVYPSDVMFSLSRTMSFAEQPGVGSQPGWIQAQALLQYGGYGIHQPWNNTPAPVLSSMLVNDTRFCPAAAMTSDNGCITFNAVGSGSDWPFFLQLVADPLGAGIQPCGWYTHVGAGLPGFAGAGTNVPNGDGPCLLPGGAHSTSDSGFQHFVSTVAPSAWDAVQEAAANNPNNPQPAVQWSMVGSGPYYALTVSKAIGYVLKANPAYQAPTGCAGQAGCEPLPGSYQGTINVYWEQDDTTGVAEYQAGQADLAGIQLPAHVSTLKSLLSAGKIDLTYIPTISIFFQTFNFDMNISGQNAIPGNTGTTNLPADFYSNLGMRELFITAYPYTNINATLLQAGGISTGIGYGGAVPKYLGNYYSYNVTWPDGAPDTNPNDVGGAAWWWAQMNNASSPWYDSELANYSTSSPAVFPIVGETGSTFYDAAIGQLIGWIVNITGGVFQPYTFDITFHDLVHYFFSAGPGNNVLPLANLGWAPDYPDPTDYTVPMYYPDSTYTYGDAVAEQLALPQYNDPSCPYADNYSTPSSAWGALVYYHSLSELPTACQGIAYSIMLYWQQGAAPLAVGPQRTLDFQMANQLGYLLALYIYNFQSVEPTTYGPWIDPATLNTNVMIGGGGDNTWYTLGYTSGVNTVTFTQTGLASGTQWSVAVGGTSLTSSGTSASGSLAAAVYNYTVGFVPGYTVSPAVGTVDLTSGAQTVALTFTAFSASSAVPVTFSAAGLVTGNGWSVLLTTSGGVHAPTAGASGLGLVTTQAQSVTIKAPSQTSYDFVVSGANGYTVSGNTGTINTGASGTSHTTTFAPTKFSTFGITITESGLISGATWGATVNGVSQKTTAGSLTFYAQNGSYSYTISASGWAATPPSGTFVVNGSGHSQGAIVITQAASFVFVSYTITYNQAGLPPAGSGTWSVAVNGASQTGTGATAVLVFTFTNATSINSNFTYVVTAPSGYTVSPSAGTLSFGLGSQVVNLTFTSTSGSLSLTGLPSGATCWIAGVQYTATSAGVCTSGLVPAGAVSYEVQASGYYTYFNNATVGGGQAASVPVSMTSVPSTSTSWSSLSTLAYIIIAVLAVLVVVFIVTTVMARGKPPMGQPPESWKGSESTTPSEQPPK